MKILNQPIHICRLTMLVLAGGCQQKVDTPPPPVAPPAAEWAQTFNAPLGDFSADRQEAVLEWVRGPGGIGAAVGLIIGEVLLSQWLSPLSADEGAQEESEMIPALEGLQVDGWAKLMLPCASGELSFSLLLSEAGIEPVIWGELSACEYPDLGLAMDGSITLFMPRFSPVFSDGGWGAGERNGVWLWLDGTVALNESSAEVNTALEISSSEGRAKTLYEESGARFVISLEGIDDFDDIESSLMTLTLLVEAGEVSWRCSVESQGCEEVEP